MVWTQRRVKSPLRRRHAFALVPVVAIALLAFGLRLEASGASPKSVATRQQPRAVESYSDARIVAVCDRTDPGESMGLSKPTVVDRIGGADAVIFATDTQYSACIVNGAKNVESNEPTAIGQISHGVEELESLGTLKKIEGQDAYSTDTWFVVRVGPTVSAINAVVRGSSQVSKVQDQFAFVHQTGTVNIQGKFVIGVVVGFSAGGGVVGSGPLS